MADVLGVLGEALVLLRMDGSQMSADMKAQRAELEKGLKKIGEDLKTVGASMTVGLTAPILGFGTAATKSFMDFESGMKRVQSSFEPTHAELKTLEAAALEWGAKTKFSATEAADALSELGKAGFTSAQAIEALPAVLEMATITGMSLADAATLTADTLTQFNLKVSEAAHVNDVLVKAAQSSTIDVQQLGESFKYVGPVAAGFGITIEETAAILAAFGNSGIKAEMAGTALRNILTDLANPTKGMKDVMEALGIETLKSADGTFKLTEVIDKLREKGATSAQVMQMFGDRAGPAMVSMVTKGSTAISDMRQKIDQAEGSAKKAAETVMSGLGGALEEMRGSVETAGVAIGKILAPMVTAGAQAVGKLADIVTNYVAPAFDALPVPLKLTAAAIVGIVALAGPVTYALGQLVLSYTAVATASGRLFAPVMAANAAMTASGAAGTAGAAGVARFAAAWAVLAALPAIVLGVTSFKAADKMKEDAPLSYDLMAQAYGGGFDSGEESARDLAAKRKKANEELQKTVEDLAKSVGHHTGVQQDNNAAVAAGTQKIGLGTKALEAAKKEMSEFSAAVKKDIIAYDAMGKTAEEIAPLVGKSAVAIELFTKASKESAETAKRHADAMQKLRDQFSGRDLYDNARQLSEILRGGFALTRDELEGMAPTFEKAIQKMVAQGRTQTPEFRRLMQDWLKAISPSQQAVQDWSYGFWNDLMAGIRVNGPSLVARDIGTAFGGGLVNAMPAIKPDIERFVDAATGEIGLRFKKTGETIIGPSITDGIIAGLKSVEFAQNLVNVIVNGVTGGASGREIGAAIGGTVGQQIGVKLGQSIAQGLGGAAGGIIGNAVVPVLGGLVGAWLGGYIGSLFGGDDEDAVNARNMRDQILQQLGGRDGLQNMIQQADLAGLLGLATTPGGPGPRNSQTPTQQAEDHVRQLLTSTDPGEVQESWDALQPLIEAVKKQFEGLATAVQGVNTYAGALQTSLNKTIKETDEKLEAQHKAAIEAMKERGASSKEIADAEAKYAEDAKNRTYQATEEQIQRYGHLGNYVAATFSDIVRRTGDPVAAILQMEDAFNLLKEASEKFNIEGNASSRRMMQLYTVISDNKDVFQSLSGLGQIMKGLGDAIAVNKDLAGDFGKDLAEHFKTLTDRGVDTRVAMALMQPQLQQLWESQEKFGKFTDEATNALLEQAEAQGIVGKEMRSVNDKILDVLIAIADVFGADIPAGVRATQQAIDGLRPPPPMDVVVRPRIEYPDDFGLDPGDIEDNQSPGGGDYGYGDNERQPQLAHGGFSNWGMGTDAVLHGREIIAPEKMMEEWLANALPRVGDVMLDKMERLSTGGNITIAPQFSGMLANEARQFMQEQFLPMMITVLRDVGPLREQMRTTLE